MIEFEADCRVKIIFFWAFPVCMTCIILYGMTLVLR